MRKLIFSICGTAFLLVCYKLLDNKLIKMIQEKQRKFNKTYSKDVCDLDLESFESEVDNFFNDPENTFMMSVHDYGISCNICSFENECFENFLIETENDNGIITHAIFKK